LIANNISYQNGGGGIIAHQSEHVDIVNNTSYANAQTSELYQNGQVYAGFSSDIKILNNIIHANSGQKVNRNYQNVNVVYDYNLYTQGPVTEAMGSHDIIANPQFVDPSNGDFRIKSTSPAINKGYYWGGLTTDYAGKPRPAGGAYDIGAYEY
jgi:Domain of unknown function (DUF5123)/Right handed beta helix region